MVPFMGRMLRLPSTVSAQLSARKGYGVCYGN
jgi:hypothetical protein